MKELSTLIISFLLFSCEEKVILEKNEPVSTKSTKQEKPYEVLDGIIHFSSIKALSELSDSLQSLSQDALYAWEKHYNFFSLHHAIENAEEAISNNEELEKYKDLVYLTNDSILMPRIIPTFYHLICNPEGYFYIGIYKHQVTDKEVIIESPTKTSIKETYSYIATSPISTFADDSRSLSMGSNSYKGNKRSVSIDAFYCRKIAKDNVTGQTVGQQYIHIKSTAGKKVLGKYKKYKTLHSYDGLAYMVENAGIKLPDGTYTKKTVRYEKGGGAGSVGEVKTNPMDYTVSTAREWIPINHLPMNIEDVIFFQIRAKTRGTGNSGAVLLYHTPKAGIWPSFPFLIPTNGNITTTRPISNENI